MEKVVSVSPRENKKVAVVFLDGKSGVFDVAPYIKSDFFKSLNDESYFRVVRLFFTGIGWPEGQDLGPDTIAAELQPPPVPRPREGWAEKFRLMAEGGDDKLLDGDFD